MTLLQAEAEREKLAAIASHKSGMKNYGPARCAAYIARLEIVKQRQLALLAAGELWPDCVDDIEREVRLEFGRRNALKRRGVA